MQLPFGNYQIRSLCEDRQGTLWIGTRELGLYQVRQGELQAVVQTKNTIREIYEDAERNLWMLAEGEGLRKIRPRIFQVVDSHQGLPNDQIHAVCEDRNGAVWLAPQIGGLARYGAEGVVNTLPATTNLIVTSVLPDGKGGVWAGTVVGGLLHYDGTKMERLLTESPFRDRQMRVLFADREGQLWISLFPSGLARFGGNEKLIWPAYYRGLGLIDQTIWAMTEDKDGGLWGGTINGDVFRLKKGQLTNYTKTNGLPGIAVGALYVDNDGTLWAGTLGGGLGCLRDGKFKFASINEGLHDNVISQIAEDDLGFLWFGSNRGIFRVRKKHLNQFMTGQRSRFESIAYGRSDGLVNVECKGGYQPSVWKTQAGELWFATSKGAIHFDPAALPLNTNPPPLVMERVAINGRSIALNDAAELNWNHKNIEFDYTALSFVSPEKVRFRRQLLGFDPGWVEAGRSRIALYPQLPPGHYEFRFTACNNDEVWNEQPFRLAFVVKPAWWQQFWFRAAMAASFAAMVGISVRYFSMKRIRRRLARLEQEHAVEKERTRIARDIHDDLGARLTHMAYLSDLASTELPERTPNTNRLMEIAQASRQTVRALDEIVWAVNPRKDSLIHLLEYISQYANSFFRGTNIRCRQDLPAHVPDWVLPSEFRHHLFLAAKEALNNIQKHSKATEVWIRVAFQAPQLELTIEDNGAGFSTPDADASRDGLQNMRNRLATLSGACQISSQPGIGTRLVMTVSLPKVDGNPKVTP
jgi:signal transduction histidine kinase/ligand-binding sensor domain-containing protein